MTLRHNLRINQGETFTLAVPVLDANDDPVSLAGVSARGQIRSGAGAPTTRYEWTQLAGNLAFDDNNVVLTVPAATSAAWTWSVGFYDLELLDAGGVVTRLVEGVVVVIPEVTR